MPLAVQNFVLQCVIFCKDWLSTPDGDAISNQRTGAPYRAARLCRVKSEEMVVSSNSAARVRGVSHSFCSSLAALVTKTNGFEKGFAQCVEIQERPVFIYFAGESHWWDVIALSRASVYQLYSYNLRERRWVMDSRPKAAMKIVSLLETVSAGGLFLQLRGQLNRAPGAAVRFESRRSRRSSRVQFDVLVELRDEKFAFAGETLAVSLHGALIRVAAAFRVGAGVRIHVLQTDKVALGRVVFAGFKDAPHYGIELDAPENIWGLEDIPDDWRDLGSEKGTSAIESDWSDTSKQQE